MLRYNYIPNSETHDLDHADYMAPTRQRELDHTHSQTIQITQTTQLIQLIQIRCIFLTMVAVSYTHLTLPTKA